MIEKTGYTESMDYLFRLADGRRLALWSERNQIIRQLSGGGGNRSQITLRTDFLSDLSAASRDGKIYFTYRNTSRRVMLCLPDGEEDQLLFGESIESCRHNGLMLVEWGDRLYLFYIAWSPIRERYSLNVCRPLEHLSAEEAMIGQGIQILTWDEETVPEFRVITGKEELWVISGENCRRLTVGDDGTERWQQGVWAAAEEIGRWEELSREVEKSREEIEKMVSERDQLKYENSDFQEENQRLFEKCETYRLETQRAKDELKTVQAESSARLQSAVTQYNDLAEVARQLQIEGKKWRDKYYQETKKRK